MFTGLKVGLFAGTALALTGTAVADGGDIEERIASLEAMVAELRAELEAANQSDRPDKGARRDDVLDHLNAGVLFHRSHLEGCFC